MKCFTLGVKSSSAILSSLELDEDDLDWESVDGMLSS